MGPVQVGPQQVRWRLGRRNAKSSPRRWKNAKPVRASA